MDVVKSRVPEDCRYLFHKLDDMYVKFELGEGVIRRSSFLLDLVNKEYNDIG